MGENGTTTSVPFTLPVDTDLTASLQFSLQVHDIKYETEASVQLNASPFVSINTQNVTLLGNAAAFGGIGGGFTTLEMTMDLSLFPPGTLVAGANTITFRFDATDGRTSGYRVLAFNILSSGTALVAPLAYDDPSTWQPPLNDAADIAAGKALWYGTGLPALTVPVSGNAVAIKARCTDCHAQDGRDLKYFNYSNYSIQVRSIFHGLTAQQGDQIASYIRSLDMPSPGRPWNPPYQPGPGLDSQPVENWSAGAGLDAVMDTDQDMQNAMFPNGITPALFAANGSLSARETSVTVQLPDWNRWLPSIHPLDAPTTGPFAAINFDFATDPYSTNYALIRTMLKVGDAAAYVSTWKSVWANWIVAGGSGGFWTIRSALVTAVPNTSSWSPATVEAAYSMAKWGMVKNWELMQEFQLEGLSQQLFASTQADPRAWPSDHAFLTSPFMVFTSDITSPGLENNTKAAGLYDSFTWYLLQLILNNSNKQQDQWHPIDWGYTYNHIWNGISHLYPSPTLHLLWLAKGLQISNNGAGPDNTAIGWGFNINDPSGLMANESMPVASGEYINEWNGTSNATIGQLSEAYLTSWFAAVSQFTPQQFYSGGQTTSTDTPSVNASCGNGGYSNPQSSMASRIWWDLPRFRFFGVNQTLINQIAAWAQTMWPGVTWSLAANATCTQGTSGGYLLCCNH